MNRFLSGIIDSTDICRPFCRIMLASQVSIDNYAGNWSHCKLKIVWNCISFYFYRHNFQRSQKIWEFIEFCEATSIGSEKKTLIDKLISQKIALRFFQLVQLILSKIDKTISRNAIILIAPDWLEIILCTFCHVTLLFQFYQSDYPACLISGLLANNSTRFEFLGKFLYFNISRNFSNIKV